MAIPTNLLWCHPILVLSDRHISLFGVKFKEGCKKFVVDVTDVFARAWIMVIPQKTIFLKSHKLFKNILQYGVCVLLFLSAHSFHAGNRIFIGTVNKQIGSFQVVCFLNNLPLGSSLFANFLYITQGGPHKILHSCNPSVGSQGNAYLVDLHFVELTNYCAIKVN